MPQIQASGCGYPHFSRRYWTDLPVHDSDPSPKAPLNSSPEHRDSSLNPERRHSLSSDSPESSSSPDFDYATSDLSYTTSPGPVTPHEREQSPARLNSRDQECNDGKSDQLEQSVKVEKFFYWSTETSSYVTNSSKTQSAVLKTSQSLTINEQSHENHYSSTKKRQREESSVQPNIPRKRQRPRPPPVPIIAPPSNHTWTAPLSAEQSARQHIARFVEREQVLLNLDRKVVAEHQHGPNIDRKLRNDILEWLLLYMPEPETSPGPYSFDRTPEPESSSSHESSAELKPRELCRELISWSQLVDQLTISPETRFHAAYMLVRYFYLMGMHHVQEDAGDLVCWDIGVACLSLSVKFHRDCLWPLCPVFMRDFIRLAPHEMGFEQFEEAQRDVLDAFCFNLGGTPQLILDEIWDAMPALQRALGDEYWWNILQREIWMLLFDAVIQPGMLKFSISILTGAALIQAFIATLVRKATMKRKWYIGIVGYRVSTKEGVKDQGSPSVTRWAKGEAEDIFEELVEVLDCNEDDMIAALEWFEDFMDY
ncbi:hypothetical protein C8J56DRAFT_930327, partial [Mycena floridula]